MKEILLYSSIYSYSAADIIRQMDEAKASDIKVRINSPGGVVTDFFGIIAKFKEHENSKVVTVDGIAASGGAFFCCYADRVECLDVSQFLFHRPSYGEWVESNPELFTDDLKQGLAAQCRQLRAAMASKMDEAKFTKATGVTFDQLFSLDTRLDVWLTAKQAKACGLVQKIVNLTPEVRAELETLVLGTSARISTETPAAAAETPATPVIVPQPTTKKTQRKMTLAEFQAEHPEVHAQAVAAGVAQERDRVQAFMVYQDVDPAGVAAGIEAGTPMTQKATAEFNRKALSAATLTQLGAEGAAALTTAEVGKELTAEQKALAASNKTVADLTAAAMGIAPVAAK